MTTLPAHPGIERHARPEPLELTYAPMHIVTKARVAVRPRTSPCSAEARVASRAWGVASQAAAKTAIAESAAINAIAVAQCRTTEVGAFARRTVSAPRKI